LQATTADRREEGEGGRELHNEAVIKFVLANHSNRVDNSGTSHYETLTVLFRCFASDKIAKDNKQRYPEEFLMGRKERAASGRDDTGGRYFVRSLLMPGSRASRQSGAGGRGGGKGRGEGAGGGRGEGAGGRGEGGGKKGREGIILMDHEWYSRGG